MPTKPTFFISSTIFDFSDLRSAVKFYLEENGCAVLASEFNDFGQPLDIHSYEACLTQIRAADYFVLFVGSRVGGWYDKDNLVSITRQEYREAYKLHKQGKLKIIALVRGDIWAIKEDRKALSRYLEATEVDEGAKHKIASHPSKAVNNAEFIIDFLDEIGRNKETAASAKSRTAAPTGNWIYVFNRFGDVADTLRAQVFGGRPGEKAAYRKILRGELLKTLSALLMKSKESAFFPEMAIVNLAAKYQIKSDEFLGNKDLSRDDVQKLLMCLISTTKHTLRSKVLEDLLGRDVFLEFNFESGGFQELPVYDALVVLRDEINHYNLYDRTALTKLLTLMQQYGRSQAIPIPVSQLIILQSVLDRALNITNLCKSIIKHLDGAEFVMPVLRHLSPIVDQTDKLDKEKVTVAEVEAYLNESS